MIHKKYWDLKVSTTKIPQEKPLNIPRIRKPKRSAWNRFVHGIWDDVVRITTVHGVPGIFQRNSTRIERYLLALGLLVAIYILSLTTWNIFYIYRHKPMRTVIAELNAPIYRFSFPEVNICNRHHFNWQRYQEAKETFLRPEHLTPKYEALFREVLESYDSYHYGRFKVFKTIAQNYSLQELHELDYVNFTQVAEVMAWRCYEMFSDCTWRNHTYDCCELFEPRRSQTGQCLSFNSVETEEGAMKRQNDPYYPRHTLGRGIKNGLTLRVHIRNGWHSPRSLMSYKGILFMLVEPDVWSYWHRKIPTNSRVFISIAARLTVFNQNTRQYSPALRNCVFEDESTSTHFRTLEGHEYRFENCYSECEQEYLMEFCNCSVDMFFPPSIRYPPCRLSDFPCLFKYRDELKNFQRIGEEDYVGTAITGMICPCFFDCTSLSYHVDYRVEHIPEKFIDPNDTGLEVSVYFLWDTATIYETSAVYTVVDLMASIGGLAGLCIGCSLVGITELWYFLFVDMPKRALRATLSVEWFRPRVVSPEVRKLFVKRKPLPYQ